MIKIGEYAEKIDLETSMLLSEQYEEFEKTGICGDNELREHVEKLIEERGLDDNLFHAACFGMMSEIWRKYFYRYADLS